MSTYSDRNTGNVGVYATSLMENWVDYSKPQENGNKVDLRWISLTNAQGEGLRFYAENRLSCNVLPWDKETISKAHYSWQLPTPEAVHLNVDFAQMGVGGDNSWGLIAHAPYRLDSNKYSYRYLVAPMDGKFLSGVP
ncbi:MAG: hypothetical protein AAGB46_17905 [Verrucomicrobiota bacterium]